MAGQTALEAGSGSINYPTHQTSDHFEFDLDTQRVMSDSIKRKLIDVENVIRRKVFALKLERGENDAVLDRFYKPITDPLKMLAGNAAAAQQPPQLPPQALAPRIFRKSSVIPPTTSIPSMHTPPTASSAAIPTQQIPPRASPATRMFSKSSLITPTTLNPLMSTPPTASSATNPPSVPVKRSTSSKLNEVRSIIANLEAVQRKLDFSDGSDSDILAPRSAEDDLNISQKLLGGMSSTAKQHFKRLFNGDTQELDTTFGITYNHLTRKFQMGDTPVQVSGQYLIIDGTRYEGTPGLYELIFNKKPKFFEESDKTMYGDIINKTHVAYRKNDPTQQLRGSTSHKYREIIKPMLPGYSKVSPAETRSKRSQAFGGEGFDSAMTYDLKSPVQYRYWDNLEELVDRLCLLHAAQKAGNSSVGNEILAIEEELREADIIE